MSTRISWILACCALLLFQTAVSRPLVAQSGLTQSVAAPAGTSASQVQRDQPAASQFPVIHAGTTEVLLDVIVRDKHRHAVKDLRPEEVEVDEDGVPQKVRLFRNVQGADQLRNERDRAVTDATAAAADPAGAHPRNSLRQANFVTVVLAQIAPLNLHFARQAVLQFLQSDNLPNTFVSIYKLNLTLGLIQPYTSDKAALAKAVERGSKGLYTKDNVDLHASVASGAYAQLNALVEDAATSPQNGGPTISSGSTSQQNVMKAFATDPLWSRDASAEDASVSLGNALLAQAELAKGLRFVDSMVNGMDTMNALRQLVHSQERLPGRKVVLYLADGITFPVNRRDVVDGLISYANRSGVSFYTIDTRGLSTDNPMMQSLSSLKRVGSESKLQGIDPGASHMQDDDVQLTASSNSQLAMTELAESTGGFAVTNTNEIEAPMQRMMEDMRDHYELAYTPSSATLDGHFRRIEVKLSRPKLLVQTRKGYYALPDLNGQPLQPFEVAALNAINNRPTAPAFPYQVELLQFQPGENAVEYQIAFEVPLSGLKSVTDAKSGKTKVHASVAAFIHSADGQIVGKVGRDLTRESSVADAAQSGSDRILYAQAVALNPGRYVMDTAVTDEATGKIAVKRTSVYVDAGSNLGLSSVEVVGNLEPLARPRDPENPFELEKFRIMPSLADSVSSAKPVSVYFVVYPSRQTPSESPKVTLELSLEGKLVSRMPLELNKPQENGSIPMLVQLSPHPGRCDIRITAQQGTLMAESTRSLKVE